MRILLLVLALLSASPALAADAPPASALDRVVATRELRCGYYIYSPYLRKDPNTGALSGIFYDLVEQVGKNAGIKIIWAEEVGFGDFWASLNNNRFDALCSGIWPNANRGLVGSFTNPVFYSVVTAWVRADDTRLNTLNDLRAKKAKITAVDGAMEQSIAAVDFPDLPIIALPQLTPYDTNFQNIISKKADVTFAEPSAVAEFLAMNPGTLRSLGADQALRTFGNTLAVKQGDTKMQGFLNAALDEIVFSGAMDKILKKYEPIPNAFPRVARPYQLTASE